MGMEANFYTIIGYDLTGFSADRFDDFKWSQEGERLFCYQSIGNIQLFDDPMSSNHLYLGFIFSAGSQYESFDTKTSIAEIERQIPYVKYKLDILTDYYSVVKKEAKEQPIQIISFVEYL